MNIFPAALAVLATALTPHPQPGVRPVCLHYEPDTVSITGVLSRRMFYGAPNFGEDTVHDAKETGFYLELPSVICTVAGKDPDVNTAQNDVRLVQLVLDSAGYAQLRPLLGKSVTLRGTMFASFTGHHHAPLLMQVVKPVVVRTTEHS